MGEKLPISFEDRRIIALETPLPRHYGVWQTQAQGPFSLDMSGSVTLSSVCPSTTPGDIQQIVNNDLVCGCDVCNRSFVWVDRKQSWSPT